MAILPAHDHLQHAMELSKRCVFPNLNAPPDRRMNVAQRHLELAYGTTLFHSHDSVSSVRKGPFFHQRIPSARRSLLEFSGLFHSSYKVGHTVGADGRTLLQSGHTSSARTRHGQRSL